LKIAAAHESNPVRPQTLTRQRVLAAAVALADREGIDAVSMRGLGQEVGVEAMSLYTHVRGKDDLLDGMVDAVVGEITVAPTAPDWRASLRRTVLAARVVILRHPWAPRIIETRTRPGPTTLRYLDGVMGILRGGGLSVELTHHAVHIMGSRLLGFTQDLYDDSGDLDPAMTAALVEQLAGTHPHVVEMALAVSHDGGLGGCDDDAEFAVGLDLILDGLEMLRDRATSRSTV
jgi:AcrR family transcriptional regulator